MHCKAVTLHSLLTTLFYPLISGGAPCGLFATTHYWSARGTEISYQIDIRPGWQSSKTQKLNYGLMTFHNSRMRIDSEIFSQPVFESLEQTIMRRVARLLFLFAGRPLFSATRCRYSRNPGLWWFVLGQRFHGAYLLFRRSE